MGSVRSAFLLFCFVAITVPAIVLQALASVMHRQTAIHIPHLYFRALTKLFNIRISTRGDASRATPCLWAANHTSWLDILVLGAVRPVTFVAKNEVADWPFFGTMARVGRTVFINRTRRSGTPASRNDLRHRLALGETVVLFPEGTSSDGNSVLPFRSALFSAVEQIDGGRLPVVPVTLAYDRRYGMPLARPLRPLVAWYGNMKLLPHIWSALALGPFEVTVVFHDPVRSFEAGDRKQLAGRCEEAVRRGLVARLTGRPETCRPTPIQLAQTDKQAKDGSINRTD